jgi:adenylylsulfate kinase-like enzyme
MIYSFIGQPHSGKTTLANHLKTALNKAYPSRDVYILDGDLLRKVLDNQDYSEYGRRKNISTSHAIARYLDSTENFDVIIAMVSPYLDLREKLKLEAENIIEIYVYTTDVRGREKYHVENFEKPESDFIYIDTTNTDELTSLNELLDKIDLYKSLKNGLFTEENPE